MLSSIEEERRYGPASWRATGPRERLHCGEPHCFVQRTSQTRKVVLGASQKQVMFRCSALRYLWAILFLFFHQKWPNKIVRPLPGTKSLSHFYLHLPTAHRMDHVPLMLKVTSCSLSCLLGRKKRKLCGVFCHWFSHMKLISLPFSGSEAAVSKSAISSCFVSVSAGEILNSLCTKLFKFYIILKLCFFGVGAHWPPLSGCESFAYRLVWQCADL